MGIYNCDEPWPNDWWMMMDVVVCTISGGVEAREGRCAEQLTVECGGSYAADAAGAKSPLEPLEPLGVLSTAAAMASPTIVLFSVLPVSFGCFNSELEIPNAVSLDLPQAWKYVTNGCATKRRRLANALGTSSCKHPS